MMDSIRGWGRIPQLKTPQRGEEVSLRLAQATVGIRTLCGIANPSPTCVWAMVALLRSLLESDELATLEGPKAIESLWQTVSDRVEGGKLPATVWQNLFANFDRLAGTQSLHPLVALGLSLAAFDEECQSILIPKPGIDDRTKYDQTPAVITSTKSVRCHRSGYLACYIIGALEGEELFMAMKQLLIFGGPNGVFDSFPFPATEHREGFRQAIVGGVAEVYARLPLAERNPMHGFTMLQLVLNTANPRAMRPESWNYRAAIAIATAMVETERGLAKLFTELADEQPSIPMLQKKVFDTLFNDLAGEGKVAALRILTDGLILLTRRYHKDGPGAEALALRLDEVCGLVRHCLIHPDLKKEEVTTQATSAVINASAKLGINWSMDGMGPFIESAAHGLAAGTIFDFLLSQIPSCEHGDSISNNVEMFERSCALLKVVLRLAPSGTLSTTSLEHLGEVLVQVAECFNLKGEAEPETLGLCLATLLNRNGEQLSELTKHKVEELLFHQMLEGPANYALSIAKVLNGEVSGTFFAYLQEQGYSEAYALLLPPEKYAQWLQVLAITGLSAEQIAVVCFGSFTE